MLNDKYIYVFVRQDLTVTQQLVHTNHATVEMCRFFANRFKTELLSHIPALIVIGTPNEKSLVKIQDKLLDNNIPHYVWGDDEFPELGTFLSITTFPLTLKQKAVVEKYKLYKEENNIRS